MEKTNSIYKYPRTSGVLLPIPMLYGPFGIGVLGDEALEFIDFLSNAGFHAWQVLPVEHTDLSFSPYACVSAFAGEPMLIDPRMLFDMGLVTEEDLSERASGVSDGRVNYELVREKQRTLLKAAFQKLDGKPYSDYKPFWLGNYALYMAIRHHYGDIPWYKWPDESLRRYDKAAIKDAKSKFADEINFYRFVQWLFYLQWQRIKEHAASRGVSIIGDMPFYVSGDSVEVWSAQNLFDSDQDGNFLAVSGTPPDYFHPDGQHWGNPIYNWKLMKKNGYKWWVKRFKAAIERYDQVRIDHFRGFDTYWRIPSDVPLASNGHWVNGPGAAFFKVIEASLGSTDLPFIAEDLGRNYGNVKKLLVDTGLRGMRVIQFGFFDDEKHIPHNITEDYVAYTGTHDNNTLLAWLFSLSPEDRDRALFYVGFEGDWTVGGPNCAVIKAWIRALFTSGASLAVVPIQDLLGYGGETRTNVPGTAEGNWRFRIGRETLGQIDSAYYNALIKVTGRDNPM